MISLIPVTSTPYHIAQVTAWEIDRAAIILRVLFVRMGRFLTAGLVTLPGADGADVNTTPPPTPRYCCISVPLPGYWHMGLRAELWALSNLLRRVAPSYVCAIDNLGVLNGSARG